MSTGGKEITCPAGNYFENKLLLNPEKMSTKYIFKGKKRKMYLLTFHHRYLFWEIMRVTTQKTSQQQYKVRRAPVKCTITTILKIIIKILLEILTINYQD